MLEESTAHYGLEVPVVLVAFNRPEPTMACLDAIRAARPQQLFLVADGPRASSATDARRCAAVRSVLDRVDWPCHVQRNYAEQNLGSKRRVETGLDWVLAQVDRAIVLEDDCIAGPSFFRYCSELLERYASDERVMAVTGNNFQDGKVRGDGDYYFSKYPHCWGWATWARAWAAYDGGYTNWSSREYAEIWESTHTDALERRYWRRQFEAGRRGRVDAWDYPWTDAIWRCGGLTATPATNLVRNVGFGADATHTTNPTAAASMTIGRLHEPLRHPSKVEVNVDADRYTFDHHFGGATLRRRRTPLGAARWLSSAAIRRVTRYIGMSRA